jgi:iron complex outermembrane receptor protein
MSKLRYLALVSISMITVGVSAQSAADSLAISKSRHEADSIRRAINSHSGVRPSTPRPKGDNEEIETPVATPVITQVKQVDSPSQTGIPPSTPQVPAISTPDPQGMAKQAADSNKAQQTKAGGNIPAGGPPMPAGGRPQGGAPVGAPQGGYGGMKMAIGHVFGKVIDAQKKPVSYAAVSIKTLAKDSLIGGQLTEDNGDFSITDLPFGAYNLKISYLGYKDVVQKVVVTPAKTDQDVGDIVMAADATKLKEVDVTATKSTMELKVDRKVFNVGADISARGGTGLDVMKNIPSVSIDASGNVTLRNNTPQVYVDGKPTTLTLEQIPADQIDRVEVITNPSAKFEASSSGGIINVVMKRNGKPGYNGIVNANIATNTGYNGLAMINLKQKKFGVSLMYTINGATNRTHGYSNTRYLDAFSEPTNSYVNQDINSDFKRIFQVARVAFDFYINNRNTLTISENAVFGNFNTTDNIGITRNMQDTMTHGTQVNTQANHFRNFTTDLNFKHTYPKEGKEYTIDIQYNHSQGGGNYLYTNTNYYPSGSILASDPRHQTFTGAQHADMITAQWDLALPIKDNMKIELGLRSNYKLTYSSNTVYGDSTLNGVTSIPEFDRTLSNDYKIDDLVDAAYITFTHQIKGFSYQLGLRAEQVYYKGTSRLNSDSSFAYQYPTDVASIPKMLFPSFNISQKWGTKHELQFNVARKVNRPNFFQIAPFVLSSTANSIQRGNPSLQPEFINQAEINYNLSESKVTWLTSVYGRYVQQPITTYVHTDSAKPQLQINTFQNNDYSVSGGWENTLKIYPVKKLDITLTGNVFYTSITGNVADVRVTNSGWSWLGKAIISYKLPLDFTIQANGTYESPKILPQGKTIPMGYFDLSISKDFMGFITLNLTVSDVLNSRTNGTQYYQASENSGTTFVPGFTQDSARRRDQRFAKLGVSFRFGKMDASFFKKKKSGNGQQGGDDMGF